MHGLWTACEKGVGVWPRQAVTADNAAIDNRKRNCDPIMAWHGMTYLVHDYDEAIDFFTRALRFTLIEDVPMGADWLARA